MTEPRIFNVIWRINAILILIAGLCIVALLGYAVYERYKERWHRESTVNVASGVQIDARWRLGSFERIAETDYLITPVYSDQSYSGRLAASKEATAVRNYLFVNAADKSSRWLIPTNDYLFLNETKLYFPNDERADETSVKWREYEVVKSDTNHDGQLTYNDRRTAAVSDMIGTGYAEVIADIDQIFGAEMRDANTQLIFYSRGAKNYVSEINLPERKVTVTKELPQLQSK